MSAAMCRQIEIFANEMEIWEGREMMIPLYIHAHVLWISREVLLRNIFQSRFRVWTVE